MAPKQGWYWPLLLGLGMSGIVGVNVWMLVVASGDANGSVVEPDYYRKAVAWDSTMAVRAASDRLLWRAEVSLTGASGAASTLEIQLADSTGAGVAGAQVAATLIHNADAARHVEVTLRDLGDGRYAGEPVITHGGLWEVRITAVRGAEHFVHTRHTDLAARHGD
jgi:nitrogen fixation protein FixH